MSNTALGGPQGGPPTSPSDVVSTLALEGHDSELFSFLETPRLEILRGHLAATRPLWVPCAVTESGALNGISVWNTSSGWFQSLAWRSMPPNDGDVGEEPGYYRVHGFVMQRPRPVEALVVIRHAFVQGYTAILDHQPWIERPADPYLERLSFIRRYDYRSTRLGEWDKKREHYFRWAEGALDRCL